AKLYYLRDRVGKKTRVKELLGEKARRERERDVSNKEAQATAASERATTKPATATEE
ncbi:MAG: hypothetical protein ACI8X5_003411, partial [Planctomycetota bacterium]